MKRISYFLAVFRVAARRLWHQRGMALSLLLGLTTAVAVSVSIPIYADAVSYRVRNDRLYGGSEDEQGARRHPPFSFLLRYVGSWHGFLEWEETRQIDEYLIGQAS